MYRWRESSKNRDFSRNGKIFLKYRIYPGSALKGLRTKIFGGKSFRGKGFFNNIVPNFSLRLMGNDSEGCRKMFFYSRYLFFNQKTEEIRKCTKCLYNVCCPDKKKDLRIYNAVQKLMRKTTNFTGNSHFICIRKLLILGFRAEKELRNKNHTEYWALL